MLGLSIRNPQGLWVQLNELAQLKIQVKPSTILRDQQQQVLEISASIDADYDLKKLTQSIKTSLRQQTLPLGYGYYLGDASQQLQKQQLTIYWLLGLAIFLVFAVMAIQYESLSAPLLILVCLPFSLSGVAAGIYVLELSLSMPVWLGLIMLTGMVVNNLIILLETIQQQISAGLSVQPAILQAAGQRVRPIMMTTLTTVAGLLPLSWGWGQGSAMLQPLAIVLVWGLSFALLVSLFLLPVLYSFRK